MIEKYGLTGKLCHYSVGEGLAADPRRQGAGPARHGRGDAAPRLFRHAMLTHANRPWMQMNPPLRGPGRPRGHARGAARRHRRLPRHRPRPAHLAEKDTGVSGQPHLDTYGPFVTWLLVEQGFTPERIAAICSANPGAFVNPYQSEKFGRLLPGYVGSLTVLDLQRPTTIRREDLRTHCGWSPFEGVTFPGSVAAVFVRGRRV